MKDLISVVVPIYNVERFLPICIESIISQSYKKLQIILVDDGSTDNCGNICDEYASRDERVEFIHKQNGGLSDARNVGIERAKGKYITFVDSDDAIEFDMIEYLYGLMFENEADISVCQKLDVDESGQNLNIKGSSIDTTYVLHDNETCMHDFLAKRNISVTAWGKLYRLDLFHDIRYPLGKYHEDTFTTYKLIGLSDTIVVGNKQKYLYRHREGSIMLQSFSVKHLDAIDANIEKMNYISRFYPTEISIACADVIYSVNRCAYRMGKVGCFEKLYIDRFKNLYVEYLPCFLVDRRFSIFSKIFALLSRLNLMLVLKIISRIRL